MALGIINPLGAVCLWDGENPRTFTAIAREVISGGDFVCNSGITTTVGSQASSYVTADIAVSLVDTWGKVNGIALNNAGSAELVTVATRGTYLLKSAGIVSGGMFVTLGSNFNYDGVVNAGMTDVGSWAGVIGRALTSAGSENYCLVSLNI